MRKKMQMYFMAAPYLYETKIMEPFWIKMPSTQF